MTIRLESTAKLPIQIGGLPCDARIFCYELAGSSEEIIAIVIGDKDAEISSGHKAPMVRVHSGCLTGDVFGSLRCDCGEQLQAALEAILANDYGALVYLPGHEGRGIGLANKIRAYALQDAGYDTVDANITLGFAPDNREFLSAADVLKDLEMHEICLLTNNPEKARELETAGISIRGRVPLVVKSNPHNQQYLKTKSARMGHLGL
jgi:GTP cyclohydrolase II